jgi:hypothetical protein
VSKSIINLIGHPVRYYPVPEGAGARAPDAQPTAGIIIGASPDGYVALAIFNGFGQLLPNPPEWTRLIREGDPIPEYERVAVLVSYQVEAGEA